jgi:hypothetical protein
MKTTNHTKLFVPDVALRATRKKMFWTKNLNISKQI